MRQEYEYIQRSADGPNDMSIAMTVMEQSVRCLPRPPLLPYRASCNDWSPRPAGPHRGPSSTRTLVSVCCMSEAAWDAVFKEDGGEESKLAKGIQAKIIAAAQATEEGDTLLIPSRGAHASAGKQWRIVVELAAARDLTPTELQLFDIWLEERWGTEVAETFAKPLRNVILSPPSARAAIVPKPPEAA